MALNLVDYVRGAPDMTKNFMQGYNLVDGIQKNQMQQQLVQQKMLQEQQKQAALQDFINNPNKTAEDYLNISLIAPEVSEPLKQYHASLDEDQKEAKQSTALNIFAALESGNTAIAKNIIDENMEGAKNSNNMQDFKMFENLSQTIQEDPEAAKKVMGLYLSHALGGDKFSEVYGQIGKERRAQEMQPFEVKAKKQKIISDALNMGLTKAEINKRMIEAKKLNYEVQNADELLNFDKEKLKLEERVQNYKEQEPIIKRKQQMPKARRFAQSFQQKHDNVNQTIYRALQLVEPLAASFGSKSLSSIDGTQAKNLKSLINTIEANVALSALQDIRQNSPTGGALGGIAVKELEMLGDTVQDLDQGQSIGQLKENLIKTAKFLHQQNKRIQQAYIDDYGDLIEEDTQSTPEVAPMQQQPQQNDPLGIL